MYLILASEWQPRSVKKMTNDSIEVGTLDWGFVALKTVTNLKCSSLVGEANGLLWIHSTYQFAAIGRGGNSSFLFGIWWRDMHILSQKLSFLATPRVGSTLLGKRKWVRFEIPAKIPMPCDLAVFRLSENGKIKMMFLGTHLYYISYTKFLNIWPQMSKIIWMVFWAFGNPSNDLRGKYFQLPRSCWKNLTKKMAFPIVPTECP